VIVTSGKACLTPGWGKSPFCFEKQRFFRNTQGSTALYPPRLLVPELLPSGTSSQQQQQQHQPGLALVRVCFSLPHSVPFPRPLETCLDWLYVGFFSLLFFSDVPARKEDIS